MNLGLLTLLPQMQNAIGNALSLEQQLLKLKAKVLYLRTSLAIVESLWQNEVLVNRINDSHEASADDDIGERYAELQ